MKHRPNGTALWVLVPIYWVACTTDFNISNTDSSDMSPKHSNHENSDPENDSADSDENADTDTDTEPETVLGTGGDTRNTDADIDTGTDADSNSNSNSDSDTDSDTDTDTDTDADTDTDIDTNLAIDTNSNEDTDDSMYGKKHSGQYHLGPVDFAETEWHNACAPEGGYRDALHEGTGLGHEYLAGVSSIHAEAGGLCDACIHIETDTGRSIIARVVTYGDTNDPGDIDVSPSIYEALNTEEWPRHMTWQLAKCPDTGPLKYEFQTGAHHWWTSFWVRNQRIPVTKVEVKSKIHPDFTELRLETDGTLNADSGFGEGEFTLRLTAMDGQVITDTFSSFDAGELIVSTQQFQ